MTRNGLAGRRARRPGGCGRRLVCGASAGPPARSGACRSPGAAGPSRDGALRRGGGACCSATSSCSGSRCRRSRGTRSPITSPGRRRGRSTAATSGCRMRPTDRINEFQPLAEQEQLFGFAATGGGALDALPQFLAQLAILVAVYGLAQAARLRDPERRVRLATPRDAVAGRRSRRRPRERPLRRLAPRRRGVPPARGGAAGGGPRRRGGRVRDRREADDRAPAARAPRAGRDRRRRMLAGAPTVAETRDATHRAARSAASSGMPRERFGRSGVGTPAGGNPPRRTDDATSRKGA